MKVLFLISQLPWLRFFIFVFARILKIKVSIWSCLQLVCVIKKFLNDEMFHLALFLPLLCLANHRKASFETKLWLVILVTVASGHSASPRVIRGVPSFVTKWINSSQLISGICAVRNYTIGWWHPPILKVLLLWDNKGALFTNFLVGFCYQVSFQ